MLGGSGSFTEKKTVAVIVKELQDARKTCEEFGVGTEEREKAIEKLKNLLVALNLKRDPLPNRDPLIQKEESKARQCLEEIGTQKVKAAAARFAALLEAEEEEAGVIAQQILQLAYI